MIVVRDLLHRQQMTPAWLDGCANVYRRHDEAGDVLIIGDALYADPPKDPAAWIEIPAGWAVINIGAFIPRLHLRADPVVPRILPVTDRQARGWHAQAVLAPDGSPAIPLPLTRIDGIWRRQPTPPQFKALEAARTARDELQSGRLARGQLPLEAACDIACTLLESIYHLSAEVLAALALLDDDLMVQVLTAASGFLDVEA